MKKSRRKDTTPYEYGMAEMERNAAKRSVKKVGKHQSLVQRLRAPTDTDFDVGAKINAIGEALAYLIEKKHMKIRVKRRGG